MKFRKSLYLVLALVLPVGIFLFLKFFGKNQFDVEPLFQEQVEISSDCNSRYNFPYVVPDSIATTFQVESGPLTIVVFEKENLKDNIQKQKNRLAEEFADDAVTFRHVAEDFRDFSLLKNCVFLMTPQSDVVLIDDEKRIRGQYEMSSLEDMDRLIVEIKIILKQY